MIHCMCVQQSGSSHIIQAANGQVLYIDGVVQS